MKCMWIVAISILSKSEFRLQSKNLWSHLVTFGRLEGKIFVKKVMANDLSFLIVKAFQNGHMNRKGLFTWRFQLVFWIHQPANIHHILGSKLLLKFIIDLSYYFKTLSLHIVNGLLESNTNIKCVQWCFNTW